MIRHLYSLLLSGFLVLLAACHPAESKQEATEAAATTYDKELNVFNWTVYMPPEVIGDFERETNTKINYEEYGSSEEMLAKVGAGSKYDLVFPGIEVVPVMIKKDMLMPLDKEKIPNLSNVDPSIIRATQEADPGNTYSVPYNTGIIAIVYWKDKVKNPVDSYKMLLDPSLKGKILILDDMREVYGAALCSLGFDPNSTVPAQIDAATNVILSWKNNALDFTNDQIEKFKTQEIYAVLGYPENILSDLTAEEKQNVDIVIPKEKSARYLDTMVIPKDAKNSESALAFINFIYRPENLARIADLYGYPGISEKSQPLRKKTPSYSLKEIESYEVKKPLGNKLDLYAKPWEEKIKIGLGQ